MIHVLLAEDQTIVRRGIVTLLALTPDIRVTSGSGGWGRSAGVQDAVPHHVAILDVRMPKLSGPEVIAEWKRRGHAIPTILLTTFDDDALFLEAVQVGAHGFLLKDVSLGRLAECIRISGHRQNHAAARSYGAGNPDRAKRRAPVSIARLTRKS